MNGPFGETRTRVEWNHAVIGPDGHVPALPPGWGDAEGVILISPEMRGGFSGPRFCQYLVRGGEGCRTTGAAPYVQRLVYVLAGSMTLDGESIAADGFAYLPGNDAYELTAPEGAGLLVFEKVYEPLDENDPPTRYLGTHAGAPAEAFLGDEGAQLATLLPTTPEFDMAVNVFTFQPGTPLPLVETHVMEHGLYMRAGQGVYRLGENWYPVQKGDVIWMASFCPQWFVAMGKEPASYIYYKDVNRDPMGLPD